MRAAVVRDVNAPLRIEELRDPEPKAGEVLVQVAGCGVCHSDLHVQDGSIPFPMPVVLGHEISGTVLAVGEGVDDVRVGERVAGAFIMPCGDCDACDAGREELCEEFFKHNRKNGTLYDGTTRLYDAAGDPVAMYSMGGLAEQAVLPARAVAQIPDGLPLADSAIFGCALMTAYGAVATVAALRPGEDVAVIGAGGVGVSLIQVARALGAGRIVAIDLDDDKLAFARSLGATDTVNASSGDAVELTREATDGNGPQVAFEAIGNPRTFRQATEMVADGGRCVMIGIAAPSVTGEVEITRLVRRKLQILGSLGGRPRQDLAAVMQLALEGKLELENLISARFGLDQAAEAYGLLADGKIQGRGLIEFGT
jgi:S-(hydroxymethyl)glutathione dehydrogenase/alcohol dehydrogenase